MPKKGRLVTSYDGRELHGYPIPNYHKKQWNFECPAPCGQPATHVWFDEGEPIAVSCENEDCWPYLVIEKAS